VSPAADRALKFVQFRLWKRVHRLTSHVDEAIKHLKQHQWDVARQVLQGLDLDAELKAFPQELSPEAVAELKAHLTAFPERHPNLKFEGED